jgi:hypothetical protein
MWTVTYQDANTCAPLEVEKGGAGGKEGRGYEKWSGRDVLARSWASFFSAILSHAIYSTLSRGKNDETLWRTSFGLQPLLTRSRSALYMGTLCQFFNERVLAWLLEGFF